MSKIDYVLELDTVITNALLNSYQNSSGTINSVGMKKVESYYNCVKKHLEREYNFRVIDVPGNNRMFKLSVMHDDFFVYANKNKEDFLLLKSGVNLNKIKEQFTDKLPWQVRSSLYCEESTHVLLHKEGEFVPVEKK